MPGCFGRKYFILNNNVPGAIFVGWQMNSIKSDSIAKLSKIQDSTSPILRPLKQDQFSFDMELCDIISISNGTFDVVLEERWDLKGTPKTGVLFQCYKRPEDSANLIEFLTILTTNTVYEQLYKNKISMST
ncbi:uncharacterized protein LOC134228886 isoform X2 [Saccostrea cucullata]|uniref:uncharacterized protein LOC134228886 isoform X2 n=1 Tax=Saccostrea cuccullata TaxID=36930 RepID=UPI002ED3C752